MERIKQTLKEYSDRFVCGREFKRAPAYYALRHSGPPLTPRVFLQPHEKLCDELLVNKFKLLLMPEEGVEEAQLKTTQEIESKNVTVTKDVYEFHTDEDDEEVVELDAEADTSEDEIPIKKIMEMAKKQSNNQAAAKVKSGEQNVILMFK